ncbi:MAG: redox-regulated ATPase YchF [Candidatus Cloacimonetes bacterium]|nr:redox-regulated ATPase YchF [Candidatus Cloacimonadota bacterium]
MGLSIGIVGLPNVGKSTLFNALTRAQNAESANYPFCTIEPNKAIVPVPDKRADKLAELVRPQRVLYNTIDFCDIAGLVKGASRGEGLGNKFLGNIRETDTILHVVRCFEDDDVVHVDGSVDPVRDVEVIETELILADLQTLESRIQRLTREAKNDKAAAKTLEGLQGLVAHLETGKPAVSWPALTEQEELAATVRGLGLMSAKPVIYCANVDEAGLHGDNSMVQSLRDYAAAHGHAVVRVCARAEEELAGVSDEERAELLAAYGVEETGLEQLLSIGFASLGLISYFTAGEKEVRAWTIHKGWKAPMAAGVIHSDFEKGFIRAEVIAFDDYVKHGTESACRSAGCLRVEGRDYEVQDGDVMHFRFNV